MKFHNQSHAKNFMHELIAFSIFHFPFAGPTPTPPFLCPHMAKLTKLGTKISFWIRIRVSSSNREPPKMPRSWEPWHQTVCPAKQQQTNLPLRTLSPSNCWQICVRINCNPPWGWIWNSGMREVHSKKKYTHTFLNKNSKSSKSYKVSSRSTTFRDAVKLCFPY